jgi:hypothetical protein
VHTVYLSGKGVHLDASNFPKFFSDEARKRNLSSPIFRCCEQASEALLLSTQEQTHLMKSLLRLKRKEAPLALYANASKAIVDQLQSPGVFLHAAFPRRRH